MGGTSHGTYVVRSLMQIYGVDIVTIYLWGLVITGTLTLLYMLFGDLIDAIGDITPGSILNPTVVLSFFAILCASGFIFEESTKIASFTILIISLLIALVLVSLLHFFILVPLSKAEQNTASSINDFVGKTVKVITTIPIDGLGEVVIPSQFGTNIMAAKSKQNIEISEGTMVLVHEVDNRVLVVERIDT